MAPSLNAEALEGTSEFLAQFAHGVGQSLAETSALLVRVNVLDLLATLSGKTEREPHSIAADLVEKLEGELGGAQERVRELREQLDKLEERLRPLLQPPTAGSSEVAPLSAHERVILRAVFNRLRLLAPEEPLPPPDAPFTGVQKHSRLFLFYLRAGSRFLAKFDEPERARKEWEAINALRAFNLPPETILPHAENVAADGVLIYPAAGGHGLEAPRPLAEYLRQCLITSPESCRRALDLALEPLAFFHAIQPGHFTDRHPQTGQLLAWHEFVRGFPAPAEQQTLPPVPGLSDESGHLKLALPSGPRQLLNPWQLLEGRLARLTGRLRLSRIHGDLNLANILISPQSNLAPVRANLIDLAQSAPEQPAALDLARLELAFGIEVFLPLVAQAEAPPEDWITDLVLVHDQLVDRAPLPGLFRTRFAQPMRAWLHHLRCQSAEVLAERKPTESMLVDYFHALFFLALRMLRFEPVRAEPPQCWLLLLTAALAAQYLEERDHAAYSDGKRGPPARPELARPG